MRFAAYESQTLTLYNIVLDFFFALFLNDSAQKVSGVEIQAKIVHFLTSRKKYHYHL